MNKTTNNTTKNTVATKMVPAFSLNLGLDWYFEGQIVDVEDTHYGKISNATINCIDETRNTILVSDSKKSYRLNLETLKGIKIKERRVALSAAI